MPRTARQPKLFTNAVYRYRNSTDGEGRLTAAADPTAASREVLATVPATRIPYPRVSQTRPGGRLMVAAHGALTRHGLAALIVGHDGTARGHHLPHTGGFISLSAQRHPDVGRPLHQMCDAHAGRHRPSRIGWRECAESAAR